MNHGDNDGQPIKGNNSSSTFDNFGNYWHCVIVQYIDFFQQNDGSVDPDDIIDQFVYDSHQIFVEEDIAVSYDVHENGIYASMMIVFRYQPLSLNSPLKKNPILIMLGPRLCMGILKR
jgi:hypothetical protein